MPISCHPTTLKRTEDAILAGVRCQPACLTAAAMLHSSRMSLDQRSRFNERWATLSKEAFQTIVNTILDKMTALPAAVPANCCAGGTRSDVIADSSPPANSEPLVQSCSPGGALCQQNSGVNDCCIQSGDIIGSYAAAAAQTGVERWRESVGCDIMVTGDSRKAGKRYNDAGKRQRSDHRRGLQVTAVTGKTEGGGEVLSPVGADIEKCEHKHCCISDDWSGPVTAPTDITLLGGSVSAAAVTTAATTAASVAAAVSATTAGVGVNEPHTPRRHGPIFEANDGREIDSSSWAGGMAAASAQCIKCTPVVSSLDEVAVVGRRQDAHQWVRLSKSTLFSLVEELVAATAEERETRTDGSGGRAVVPREACTPPFRCDDRRHRRATDKSRETAGDLCRDLCSASDSGGIMSPAIGRLNFVKRELAGSPPLAPVLATGKRQCWAAVNKAVVFTVFDQAMQSDCRRVPVAATPPCLFRNGIHGSPSVQSDSDESSVLDLSSKENIENLIDERSPNPPSDDPPRFNGTDSWKPNSKRRSTDGPDASRRGKKRKRGSADRIVRTWEDNGNNAARRDTASDVDKSPSPPLRNSKAGSASPCSGVDVNCNRKQVGKASEVSECDGDSASLSQPRTPRGAAAPTNADDTAGRPTLIVCTESQRCRNSRESPKLGWVAVSQDEVHTIVDTVVGNMLTPCDTNTASFPSDRSPFVITTISPSPVEPSSSAASISSNIPRPRPRDRRSPTDDSRQTGNDLDIGELAIYSEGEDEKTSSQATDSDPDTTPSSADTDAGGDCSPKRGFKWKSNLLMRMREEGKTEGSDGEKGEAQDECVEGKNS